jgi:hypothetical protein
MLSIATASPLPLVVAGTVLLKVLITPRSRMATHWTSSSGKKRLSWSAWSLPVKPFGSVTSAATKELAVCGTALCAEIGPAWCQRCTSVTRPPTCCELGWLPNFRHRAVVEQWQEELHAGAAGPLAGNDCDSRNPVGAAVITGRSESNFCCACILQRSVNL